MIDYEPLVKTKYMMLFLEEEKPKTAVYRVESKDGDVLGTVKWCAPWRQYCYFPVSEIIMARSCLKELCDFIQKLMDNRKKKK